MKVLKSIIICFLLLSFSSFSYASSGDIIQSSSGQVSPNVILEDKLQIDAQTLSGTESVAEKRIDYLKELKDNSPEEEKIKSLNAQIKEIQIAIDKNSFSKDAYSQLINSFNQQISQITEENKKLLLENNQDNNKLIETQKQKITELNQKLTTYKSLQESLSQEQVIKQQLLNNYVLLKNQYEKQQNSIDFNKQLFLSIILLILLSIWFFFLKYNKYKNDKEEIAFYKYKTIINVFFSFCLINLIIIGFFYLNPGYGVYLIFIASALIVMFKDIILSFFISIIIIYKYKVGQLIKIESKDLIGQIKKINILSIDLYEIDKNDNFSGNIIKISNQKFFNEFVSVLQYNNNQFIEIVIKDYNFYEKNYKQQVNNIFKKHIKNTIKTIYSVNDFYLEQYNITENGIHLKLLWNSTTEIATFIKLDLAKLFSNGLFFTDTKKLKKEKVKNDSKDDNIDE